METLIRFLKSCEWVALFPELALMALGIAALFMSFGKLKHSPRALYTILWGQVVVIGLSLCQTFFAPRSILPPLFGGTVNPHMGHEIACSALQALALVIAWMSKRFGQKTAPLGLEYYGLLLAATVSLMFVIKASNLMVLFLGLEASSLFIVLLLAICGRGAVGLPAAERAKTALKYLFQSGLAAVLMLWGIVLIYTATGSLQYEVLAPRLMIADSALVFWGAALVFSALIFKLGLFPFTFYLPGIYEKASWPVLAFMATASKLAAVVALAGLLAKPFTGLWTLYQPTLTFILVITLLWAALSALHETLLKRLLAFSGVVHISFITGGLLFANVHLASFQALAFYFFVYFAALLLFIYSLVEIDIQEPTLDSLKSTHARHPGFAMAMVLAVASFAGLPPLGGFLAKFFIFYNAVMLHAWPLLVAMVAAGVLAIFYYLKIISSLVERPSELPQVSFAPKLMELPLSSRIFMGMMILIVLGVGLVQGPMSFLWK